MNALKAKEFYRRDVQYIVRNGKSLIVNEVTKFGSYYRILLYFNFFFGSRQDPGAPYC